MRPINRKIVVAGLGFGGLVASLCAVAGSSVDACDGIDPQTGLYSTCIRAHSAADREERLKAKGASDQAIATARAELAAMISQYAELGGGSVPGLVTCVIPSEEACVEQPN